MTPAPQSEVIVDATPTQLSQRERRPHRWRLLRPLNPTIPDWSGRRIWVIGASSGVGEALTRALYARGAHLALSARREPSLRSIVSSLADSTTPAPMVLPLDVNDTATLEAHCAQLLKTWGAMDLVMWVAGIYEPMRAEDYDASRARRVLDTNLVAVFSALPVLLRQLIHQQSGGLALVASVAGYRGLPNALVYGPTKAALIHLAEALYLDLHARGVGVYLVNPGFVDTPATARNTFEMPALMSAQAAADATLSGIAAGEFEIHYPKRFTCWLKLARMLPYRLYFWLVRRVTGG